MRTTLRLLAFCLSCSVLSAVAAQVEGLHEVREPVASQEAGERSAAMARALQSLVVRLTGDRRSAADLRLQPLLADPQQLVQQFVYEPGEPVTLAVVFDPVLTGRALREAGLSLWHVNRPQVLAWWLEEETAGNRLLAEDQPAAEALRQAARQRGVPLGLPLGDLQEQLLATPQVLAGSQIQALREASEGYAADALLTVLARPGEADWQLWLGEERQSGSVRGASREALADGVLLEVAERLAARFAAGAGAQSLTLEVQGSNLARFASLERLLEPFGAQLREVQGDRLVYRLQGTPAQVRAQLQLGRLHELPADVPAAAGQPLQVPAASGERLRFAW